MNAKQLVRKLRTNLGFWVLSVMASFFFALIAHAITNPATWTRPVQQAPINNVGQPPTATSTGYLFRDITSAPVCLGVNSLCLNGPLVAANISWLPVHIANGVANGNNISLFARNSFMNPQAAILPGATPTGVYGYATGTASGVYGVGENTSAAGTAYGLYADAGGGTGKAGQFYGPVSVLTNPAASAAVGKVLTNGGMLIDNGYVCSDAAGSGSSSLNCLVTQGAMDTYIRATSTAQYGYGYYSTATSSSAITISINRPYQTTRVVYGESPSTALGGIGASGKKTAGLYSRIQGIAPIGIFKYAGAYGITAAGTPNNSAGVWGQVLNTATGGFGNGSAYASSPQYDFSAGVRACTKDSSGSAVNAIGLKANKGVCSTGLDLRDCLVDADCYGGATCIGGAKYAAYFDGDGVVDGQNDGDMMIAGSDSEYKLDTAFDSDGVILDNQVQARGVGTDGTYIYLAGNGAYVPGSGEYDWRVEKRRLTDGRLCDGTAGICGGTEFGAADGTQDGKIIIDYSPKRTATAGMVLDSVDSLNLYVTGTSQGNQLSDNSPRVQKIRASDGVILVDDSPNSNSGYINVIGQDTLYVYLAGSDWRVEGGNGISSLLIEKRRKTDLHLCSGSGYCGNVEFGTGGRYKLDNPALKSTYDIRSDGTYLYLAGITGTAPNGPNGWRVEKRLASNGNLCTTGLCGPTNFGSGNGYVTGTMGQLQMHGLTLDLTNTYLYVVGEQNTAWCGMSYVAGTAVLEKRLASSGSLCTGGACPAGNFGPTGSGIITEPNTDRRFRDVMMVGSDIVLAGDFHYELCYQRGSGFLYERRLGTTGALIAQFSRGNGYSGLTLISQLATDTYVIGVGGGTGWGIWTLEKWIKKPNVLRINNTYLSQRNLRGILCRLYATNPVSYGTYINCCDTSKKCP